MTSTKLKTKDSYFVSLVKVLDSKLGKSGDKMNGNLDMNSYRIVNISSDSDCITTDRFEQFQKTLNRNYQNITEKIYTEMLTPEIQYEFDIEKLCRTANGILAFLNRHGILEIYNSLLNFRDNFQTSLELSMAMYAAYKNMFEIYGKNIEEISNCLMFANLKRHIVKIIASLPREMFYELKS